MKYFRVILLFLGVCFSLAGIVSILMVLIRSEYLELYIGNLKMLPAIRIGVLIGLLLIAIHLLISKKIFKNDSCFGYTFLSIWIMVVLTAIYYLGSIY